MRIEILHLFAYRGPNIFSPQPGVFLRLHCNSDCSTAVKDIMKDRAQFVGLILAHLDVSVNQQADGYIISLHVTTPTPDLAASLAEHVVQEIQAQQQEDTEWDTDTPLFAMQQRRRRESPGIAALQLAAEARERGLPVLTLPNGNIQVGYGHQSWSFAPPNAHTAPPPSPPWEHIGSIPIYAITGEHHRSAMVQRIESYFHSVEQPIRTLENADYNTTLAVLSDPSTEALLVGLNTADILRHGLAFSQCTFSIITDMEGDQPTEAANTNEWLQALGVPMLISAQPAFVNTDNPTLATLAAYAPHGVVPLSRLDEAMYHP
jgi:hypothetical protein